MASRSNKVVLVLGFLAVACVLVVIGVWSAIVHDFSTATPVPPTPTSSVSPISSPTPSTVPSPPIPSTPPTPLTPSKTSPISIPSPTPPIIPSPIPPTTVPVPAPLTVSGTICMLTIDTMRIVDVDCPSTPPTNTWCGEWTQRGTTACMFESCTTPQAFDEDFAGYALSFPTTSSSIANVDMYPAWILGLDTTTTSLQLAIAMAKVISDNDIDTPSPPNPVHGRNTALYFEIDDTFSWTTNSRGLLQQSAVTTWNMNWVPSDFETAYVNALAVSYGRFLPDACPEDEFASIEWLVEGGYSLYQVQTFIQWIASLNVPPAADIVDVVNACYDTFDNVDLSHALCNDIFEFYNENAFWNNNSATVFPNPYVDAFLLGNNINDMFYNCQDTDCYTIGPPEDPPVAPAGIACQLPSTSMTTINMSCPSNEPELDWCKGWSVRNTSSCVLESCTELYMPYIDVNDTWRQWVFLDPSESTGPIAVYPLLIEYETLAVTSIDLAEAIVKFVNDNEPVSYNPPNPIPMGRSGPEVFYVGSPGVWTSSGGSLDQQLVALVWNMGVFPTDANQAALSSLHYDGWFSATRCPGEFYNSLPWLFIYTTDFHWSPYNVLIMTGAIASIHVDNGNTDLETLLTVCTGLMGQFPCEMIIGQYYTIQSFWNSSVTPNPYIDFMLLAQNINQLYDNCALSACVSADLS